MVAYSFKRQFVAPIALGLGIACPNGFAPAAGVVRPKRHTMRSTGKRRHARPGEGLQLYWGMRTKSCLKIGDAKCIKVEQIVRRCFTSHTQLFGV